MNLRLAQFLDGFFGKISPKLEYSLAYFHNRGCFPNLKNTKNLSEIIGKQMVTGEINQFAPYADKVEVRKYIEHENFKRNILLGLSEKKYTRDILNKILEILDKENK